jgi:hypothetical protein
MTLITTLHISCQTACLYHSGGVPSFSQVKDVGTADLLWVNWEIHSIFAKVSEEIQGT